MPDLAPLLSKEIVQNAPKQRPMSAVALLPLLSPLRRICLPADVKPLCILVCISILLPTFLCLCAVSYPFLSVSVFLSVSASLWSPCRTRIFSPIISPFTPSLYRFYSLSSTPPFYHAGRADLLFSLRTANQRADTRALNVFAMVCHLFLVFPMIGPDFCAYARACM